MKLQNLKSRLPREEAQKNIVLIEICVELQLPSISQQWSKENPGNRVFFIIIAVSLFLSCSLVPGALTWCFYSHFVNGKVWNLIYCRTCLPGSSVIQGKHCYSPLLDRFGWFPNNITQAMKLSQNLWRCSANCSFFFVRALETFTYESRTCSNPKVLLKRNLCVLGLKLIFPACGKHWKHFICNSNS